jgi:hypothetical protein
MTFLMSRRAKTIVRTPATGTIQNISGNISPLFLPSTKAQALFQYLREAMFQHYPAYFDASIKRKEQGLTPALNHKP